MLLLASGLLFWIGGREGPAEAATCLKPAITVSPRSAVAGDSVVVSGRGWYEGCQDTVGCEDGGPCPEDPDASPRYGIKLRFRQGTHADALGEVDADAGGRFTQRVTIPVWAEPGASVLSADDVASGFMVTDGEPVAAPVELGQSGGGSGSAADASGEPLAKTGMAAGALLLVGGALAALSLYIRRRL